MWIEYSRFGNNSTPTVMSPHSAIPTPLSQPQMEPSQMLILVGISHGHVHSRQTNMQLALEPFHRNDEGEFWTSETVRSPHTFAYTYPELLNLNNTNDTSSLISRVNALYGPNAQFHSTKRSSISPPFESRGIAGAPNFSGRRKYTANIKVRKFGLDGSFNVYIFLGNEPIISDPQHWVREESFVGLTGILSQSRGSMGAASDSLNLDIEANGAVPLTAVLEDRVRMGELESLREDVVARHLRRRLRWRVSKVRR